MNIKACIFDLDGTLLSTLETIAYYGNRALAMHGFPSIETEKYKYLVGNGARILVERMLREIGAFSAENFDAVYRDYMHMYDEKPLYLTAPYAHIEEMLRELKSRGIRLAVLSNKPDSAVRPTVEAFFPGVFNFVRGSTDNRPLKPAPDGVWDIMKMLQLRTDEVLYIGDTAVDMDTGHNAGLFAAGCLWGFRTREELTEHKADALLADPRDILQYIGDKENGTV